MFRLAGIPLLKCCNVLLSLSKFSNDIPHLIKDLKIMFLMYDWEQVTGVCGILEKVNVVVNIVLGTRYPTSNLFLAEIRQVKQILGRKSSNQNSHIREMVVEMKFEFDKYRGLSNLVISIGAVMDSRFKMKLPMF